MILYYLGIDDTIHRTTLKKRLFEIPENKSHDDDSIRFGQLAFTLIGVSCGAAVVILLLLLLGVIYFCRNRRYMLVSKTKVCVNYMNFYFQIKEEMPS